jgi:predicted 3-demethylubiquinone-9 3-methyltransferase (glyoxalase superfamily)
VEKIATCLWFDHNAEEAARFYVGLFPDSEVTEIIRAPGDYTNGKAGDVLLVLFQLAGRGYSALNGRLHHRFNEAISMSIDCVDQAEVDRYWQALSADPKNEQCGWLKDKFGVSWQVVPRALLRLLSHPDPTKRKRVFEAIGEMKKLDVAALERAAEQG